MKSGITFRLIFSVLVASIGTAFQHGYNMCIVNTPAAVLKSWMAEMHLANYGQRLAQIDLLWGMTISIYCAGGFVGGLSANQIIKKVGSRKGMVYNNIIGIIGAFFEFISKYVQYYEVLIVGRFIVGVNSGICSGISSIYICDLAPKNLRGAMGGMYQAWNAVGLFLASLAGMKQVLGKDTTWPYMLALPVVPAVIQFITLLFYNRESPRHLLIIKEDEQGAAKVLHWLRGREADIREEIQVMKAEQDRIKSLPKLTLKDFHRDPLLRKPLIIVVVMMSAHQMSGIVSIALFSSQIYMEEAGLGVESMEWANIGLSFTGVVISLVSLSILMERVGRKVLSLIGFSLMAFSLVLLMTSLVLNKKAKWIPYMSIVCIFFFLISFTLGAGGIPWFLASELFPQNAKPIAQSFVVGTHWAFKFVVALGFGPLVDIMGYYVFVFFLVSDLLTVLFILLYVPETKNRTLAEIQDILMKKPCKKK